MDEEEFWQRSLREHEELRMFYQGSSRMGPDNNLRDHLQFLAFLLTICGL